MTHSEICFAGFSKARIADELLARCPEARPEWIDLTADTAAFLAAGALAPDFWIWSDDRKTAFTCLSQKLVLLLHRLGTSRIRGSAAENILALACVLSDQLLLDAEPAGHA
jgi:hypothetical protein